jgi:glycosyltransferase involved in cell wall biosynthesis
MKKETLRKYRGGNYLIIPNGVDLDTFSPNKQPFSGEEIEKLTGRKVSIEHPIVLSTSALEKRKGINRLIEAMKKLEEGTLLLANTGSQERILTEMGERILGNRFIYLGVLDKNALSRLYATCDIFCLPSPEEAFGNVLLEAMSCNKPVVSHDDESRRWIVGDGGVLTDVTNPGRLADAIEKAYETDFKDKPREQAKKFDWDEIVGMYEKLIYEILETGPECRK